MHEYSIVQSLLNRVGHEVAARNGVRVHRLWVRIGELSGVEVDLLRTAYEMCRASTVCAGAALEVRRQDARWECPSCGADIARGLRLVCETCGSPARLVQGDEIMLDRIEMEVP
jgi:hydrogenase nickel insertion protein HypA